jgi:tellurite methyltransferase
MQENIFGAEEPEKVVMEALSVLPQTTKAIEFGAGQGRNALEVASRGIQIKAIEISQVGVDQINEVARRSGLPEIAELGDARWDIKENYDFVISTYMLHHLSREDALKFIDMIQKHTNPGGLNAITTFTKEGDFYADRPYTTNFYPDLGELKNLYNGWEMLLYKEESGEARVKKPDGSPMFNIHSEILARKPK